MNLLQIVAATNLDAQEVAARTAGIHAAALGKSKYLNAANFTQIHPSDLELLFAEYDHDFFSGQITATLGQAPLQFGLSKRMTSAGGKTVSYPDRHSGGRWYEISVSSTILFACFHDDDHREVTASGMVCADRLAALQRVMEHELVHLIEMLLWDHSSCSQARFHSITRRFFAHTENMHRLITPRERAMAKFGIKPGMTVRFRFDGAEHLGVVNRISKRATVLVEDQRGVRYTNGKLYLKYYVPVHCLEAVE